MSAPEADEPSAERAPASMSAMHGGAEAGAQGEGRPSIWGEAVRVSDRATGGGFQNEPSIAVDAKGQVVVAWQGRLGGGKLQPFYSYSRDQGKSFAPSVQLESPWSEGVNGAGDVTLATDPAGQRVHLAWARYGSCGNRTACVNGPGSIAYTSAPAGTNAWEPAIDVDEKPNHHYVDRPWLSVAPDGEAFLIYDDFDAGRRFARRRARGGEFKTFGHTREELDNGAFLYQGSGPIAFGPGGVFTTVQFRHRRQNELFFHRWDDGSGFSFKNLGVAIYSAIDHPLNARPQTTSRRADGSVCVVYFDANAASVAVEARRIDGDTVSAPVRVSDPVPGYRAYLWMAEDERGGVHVIWLDSRGGRGWQPYTAHSADGCRTWTANQAVTKEPFDDEGTAEDFIGDAIGIAARGGRVYAAWTDTRSGRPEIHVASAPNPLTK